MGPVERAVRKELRVLIDGPDAMRAAALTLARSMDGAGSAREASTVARELRITMCELRAATGATDAKGDPLDELRTRRSTRKAV